MLGAEASSVKSLEEEVKLVSGIREVWHKMVEKGWGDDGPVWDPSPHLSGVVDHLDEEVVRDSVERLRDVHRYGYSSARGLVLIEARDHPSTDGEQGQGGGMPLFEAVLGPASAQRLHEGQEDKLLQYLHCRAEQWDKAVGAALLTRIPCLQNRNDDRVLPDCRDVDSGDWEVEELRQEGQAVCI